MSEIEEIKNKGRAYLTEEERIISKKNRVSRIKIANMISRKPEIVEKCCICGSSNAEILHNKYPKNPYYITFICKDCRADDEKLAKAEKLRIDIRSKMDKATLSAKNFVEEDVKRLVENYLMNTLSIGKYCTEQGISRHQFNQLVKRYEDMFNDPAIRRKINNHANNVNRKTLSREANERNRILK